jgi:transporter family protein
VLKVYDWFIWAVFTAIIWGVVPLFEKAGLIRADPLTGVFVRCFGGILGAIALLLIKPNVLQNTFVLDARTIIFLVIAGVLGTVAGQVFNLMAIKAGEVSKVTPVVATYPLVAFILGLIIFREPLTVQKVMAVIFILVGLVLLTFK